MKLLRQVLRCRPALSMVENSVTGLAVVAMLGSFMAVVHSGLLMVE